jgi:hypothetical protein
MIEEAFGLKQRAVSSNPSNGSVSTTMEVKTCPLFLLPSDPLFLSPMVTPFCYGVTLIVAQCENELLEWQ